MRRIRIIGLALVAVFAMSAVAATAAQAMPPTPGGPIWLVGCHKVLAANKPLSRWEDAACTKLKAEGGFDFRLFPGETQAITSKNVGTFTLGVPGLINMECKSETNTGELIGGNPGTDKSTITFSECTQEGKPECHATGAGEAKESGIIKFSVYTVLVYPKGKAEKPEEALDAVGPVGTTEKPNVFVVITTEGKGCTVNGGKFEPTATGTEYGTPGGKRKCGVLAEVGKLNAEKKFVLTKSGETAVEGALNFPGTAITEAEFWNGTAFTTIKCKFTTSSFPSVEKGLEEVRTSPEAAFGWEV
jgi:hypothetical protein